MMAKDVKGIEELGLSAKTQKYFIDRGFTAEQLIHLGREVKYFAYASGFKMQFNGQNIIISSDKIEELVKCLSYERLIRRDLDPKDDLASCIDQFYTCFYEREPYSIWKRTYRLDDSEKFNEDYEEYVPITKTKTSNLKAAIASRLTVREYSIIMDHFGLESGVPQFPVELSKKYGLTRERVLRIRDHALRKLAGYQNDPMSAFPTFEQLFLGEKRIEDEDEITEESGIERLKFSVRTYNVLKRASIHTVGDILAYPEDQWRSVKYLGLKSLKEICEAMHDLGYRQFMQ